jgi:hypothetical protein
MSALARWLLTAAGFIGVAHGQTISNTPVMIDMVQNNPVRRRRRPALLSFMLKVLYTEG